MRNKFIPIMALLLSACSVITESGTEEAIFFSGNEAGEAKPQVVLKPHNDLPLSLEFSCPNKIFSAMTSLFYPMPPVIPVGFVNDHVSYLRIRLPQDAETALARIRIVTGQGQAMALPDVPQSRRVAADGGTVEMTYALKNDCEEFDGGALEIAGFDYRNRNYPASKARLHFDSRIKTVFSYGLA